MNWLAGLLGIGKVVADQVTDQRIIMLTALANDMKRQFHLEEDRVKALEAVIIYLKENIHALEKELSACPVPAVARNRLQRLLSSEDAR